MNSSRRTFLVQLATFSAVSPLHFAFAAAAKNPEVVQAITNNIKNAEKLKAEVERLAPDMNINNNIAQSLMVQEKDLRRNLLSDLQKVPTLERSLYVMPDQRDLAKAMSDNKVPLLPDEGEITEAKVSSKPAPEKCEPFFTVAVAIILDALDLQEVNNAVIQVVDQLPELKKRLDELAGVVKVGTSKELIEVVHRIVRYVATKSFIDAIMKVLGKNTKLQVLFLRKLGARFVPFVGPIYLVICGATAILNNKERLQKAIECGRKA